jgi:hypothetical protein
MELCNNNSLQKMLKNRKKITDLETRYFMRQVRRILACQSWASLVFSVPIIDCHCQLSSLVLGYNLPCKPFMAMNLCSAIKNVSFGTYLLLSGSMKF